MILEQTPLDVIPGREAAFESAYEDAKTIIASAPGFVWLRLVRSIERPSHYLHLIWWERLQDHTKDFLASSEYQRWCSLLDEFYDPCTSEHYVRVTGVGGE